MEYKNSQKPKNLNHIKKLISLMPGWRLNVHPSLGYDVYGICVLGYDEQKNDSLIFRSLPMSAAKYKGRYMIIEAKIVRPFSDAYLISDEDGNEAVAVIDKNVLENTPRLTYGDLKFDKEVYMVVQLLAIDQVETVGGNTKNIAVVQVAGIFDSTQYSKFRKYVLGHPDEFPQEKYIIFKSEVYHPSCFSPK
ncbi:MAG: hypothetical protein U9N82_03615 [Thermodesulfobacteriota bacterium]|nr:hypothetical protein [Thermodesulfobacteriota bacterium]